MPVAKKKTSAKQTAKKTTAKKKAKVKGTTRNGKILEAAKKLLPRLKKGDTTLSAERDRLGLKSNGPLRKALTEILGSKKAYQEMMAAHSGRGFRKGRSAPKGK